MSTQVLMPALSPTMSEGKLSKWLVKEGDVVKKGDTLYSISKKYSVTIEELKKLNKLKSNEIKIGQKLKI